MSLPPASFNEHSSSDRAVGSSVGEGEFYPESSQLSADDSELPKTGHDSDVQPTGVAKASAGLPQRLPRYCALLALAILAIAAFSALPNYVSGAWRWDNPPPLSQTSQLNQLKTHGLELPGWSTQEQQTVSISGLKWSVQAVLPDNDWSQSDGGASDGGVLSAETYIRSDRPVIVMLRPQTWHRDQPQVEWMDINGSQQWTADHYQRLFIESAVSGDESASQSPSSQLKSGDRPVSFSARFFRGWSRQQTYAVVQWYAWTTGGSPSVSDWFWADQLKQLRDRKRMPWVAVSVLIPMKPLGNIDTVRTTAESLSQTIQASLIRNVLADSK